MEFSKFGIPLLLCAAMPAFGASFTEDQREVLRADSAFWSAYNSCDMVAAGNLLTADVEFYHDKTGLTTSRKAVVDSLKKGPCASHQLRLRREAVNGSIEFHSLEGGYALLSGNHQFYVTQSGQPERLDGQAEFATVWKLEDGSWRMHRVVSYAPQPSCLQSTASKDDSFCQRAEEVCGLLPIVANRRDPSHSRR